MAKFLFRHGVVRHQTDTIGNPTHLIQSGQYVNLIVSPDPTVFLIAHLTADYSVIENKTVTQAWGPFTGSGVDYLYWDVDLLTGELTRDTTTVLPIVAGIAPVSPLVDQHWFDTSRTVMNVWTGSRWIIKLRVFAAILTNSSILTPEPIGSQVGLPIAINAGQILFDDEGKPVQKWTRNRDGMFLTSETPMSSQFSRLANFRVEAAIIQAKAEETIPINYVVAYTGPNEVSLARNTAPEFPAIGISSEGMVAEEVRSFITKGYVQNFNDWNWLEPPGTPIFVGVSGELTTSPPQSGSIQRIAVVVDPVTIFVNTQDIMEF
jgi:hypothetical protein